MDGLIELDEKMSLGLDLKIGDTVHVRKPIEKYTFGAPFIEEIFYSVEVVEEDESGNKTFYGRELS